MGVPDQHVPMTAHMQHVTVRNARGQARAPRRRRRRRRAAAAICAPAFMRALLFERLASLPRRPPTPLAGMQEMLDAVAHRLETAPTVSTGDRRPLVAETVRSDDEAKFGRGPKAPAPRWVGELLATLLGWFGPKARRLRTRLRPLSLFCCRPRFASPLARRPPPSLTPRTPDPQPPQKQGLEFAKYSIDYHFVRNYLYTVRNMGAARAATHVPPFARKIVDQYGAAVAARLAMPGYKRPTPGAKPPPPPA
jgi:hypothetical protein